MFNMVGYVSTPLPDHHFPLFPGVRHSLDPHWQFPAELTPTELAKARYKHVYRQRDTSPQEAPGRARVDETRHRLCLRCPHMLI